jgi:hypothetical protein
MSQRERNVSEPVVRKTRSKSLLKREKEGRVLSSSSDFVTSPPAPLVGVDEGREIRHVKRYMAYMTKKKSRGD